MSEFILTVPSCSYWRGTRKLSEDSVSVSVKGTSLNGEQRTTPSIRGLTKTYPLASDGTPWLVRFQSLDHELQEVRRRYTVELRRGLRVAPRANVPTLLLRVLGRHRDGVPVYDMSQDVQSLAYRMHSLAGEFGDTWPDIRRQILRNVPIDGLEEKLPKEDAGLQVGASCSISLLLCSITDDNDDLAAVLPAEQLAQLQVAAQQRLDAIAEAIVRQPVEELETALSGLLEQSANSGGTVTNAALNLVAEQLDKLRAFDQIGQGRLHDMIVQLEEQVSGTVTSGTPRQRVRVDGLTAIAGQVAEQLRDASDLQQRIAAAQASMAGTRRRVGASW